jgi:hypothetical protein
MTRNMGTILLKIFSPQFVIKYFGKENNTNYLFDPFFSLLFFVHAIKVIFIYIPFPNIFSSQLQRSIEINPIKNLFKDQFFI